jgi:predicted nucleic acid-binding protein
MNGVPRYFVDANIIMDALLVRKDHPIEAMALLDMGYRRRVHLMVTPMVLGFVLAALQKNKSAKKPGPKLNMVRAMMHDLLANVEVIPAGKSDFIQSLNSSFYDIEDGSQYFAASRTGRLDGIVTRDPDYVGNVSVPLLTAPDALKDANARLHAGTKRKRRNR